MRVDIDAITYQEAMADGGRLVVIAALQAMPYSEYLQTEWWASVRRQTLSDCGHKCQLCRERIYARDVHHLTYDNRGCEEPEDVVALCERHHRMWHDNWVLRVREEGRKQFNENPNDQA